MAKGVPFGLAVLLSMLDIAQPAHAEPATRVTAEYDFSVGGFSIAEVALTAAVDESGYEARSSVVTRGVLDVLLRGRAASQARGKRSPYGQFVPTGFATHYSSRTGDQKIRIAYENASPAEIVFEPEATDSETHAAQVDRMGALDPLSAAFIALLPSTKADLCNRTVPVFDGKRRFDIIFLPPDARRVNDSAPAPEWDKPLTRCLGVYERISGFEGDVKDSERYFPFDIWFEGRGNGMFRAVRLAGNTKLGFAIGDLRGAQ